MEDEKQLQEAETPEEETSEADDQAPAKDETNWEAEAKKFKAIAERKTKQLEKVNASLKEEKEEAKPEEAKDAFISKKEFEDMRFFDKNPDYEPLKEIITGLRKEGETLEQVIRKDAFKNVFTAVKAAKEAEEAKSVLETNPRLGQVSDKMSEARAALEKGNDTEASDKAVGAVIDAFKL
jgi:hypothetical protein